MTDKNLQQSLPDLKSVRESRGLTLRYISEVTKVSITHLQAIENEDFHSLPPPVYTRSFIKKYAATLGIESSLILGRYERYLDAYRKPAQQDKAEKKSLIGKSIYKSTGAIFILIIGAILVVFLLSPNRKVNNIEEQKYPVIESKPPAVQTVNPAVTVPESAVKDGASAKVELQAVAGKDNIKAGENAISPPTKDEKINNLPSAKDNPENKIDMPIGEIKRKPYVLNLEAKELTWIRITEDDNPKPYEVLLKPGDKIERSASKRFSIDVGNAGGVDIFFQGKTRGSLGKSGEVVHLSLP
jgi:cytoskeleton protein RodZ